MKKILALTVVIMFFISTFFVFIGAGENVSDEQVSMSYYFKDPQITKISFEDEVFDQIILDGATCFGNPGEPYLPMKGAYVLLPQGTKVMDINIKSTGGISLGSGYNIIPCGKSIPVSKVKYETNSPSIDPAVYNLDDFFPGKLYNKVGLYSFRGYDILVLTLYPVQYNPVSGELFYYPELKVNVETVVDNHINRFFRGVPGDKSEILGKIDNQEIVETYTEKPKIAETLEEYDLLILTTNSLKNAFQPLKNYHDSRGVRTVIKTLNDVGGSRGPEDIREYIRYAYDTWNIEYLLLGGDADVVPDKILYVFGYDEDMPDRPYDTFMPVDMYYACLDGPFNNDGDEKWGEPTDGEGGGDIDLYAEVYVGRACVDNEEDVSNFIGKTIGYLSTDADDPYLENVCLAGEYLGDHGASSFGGNMLDELIDESTASGYTTIGIPSEELNINKIYDRDWPSFDPNNPWGNGWMPDDIITRINNGIHILQHDGHSYYAYNMKLGTEQIDEFTNTEFSFGYSSGCMAGGFDDPDGYDCFGEYITVKTNTGAFAGIWNARYGFFWSGRLDGDGSRYSRQFWDAVFGENIPIIGKANQDSKEDNIFLLERATMRWTYYELNLFGDPSVPIRVNFPDKPSKPNGPSSGNPNTRYTFCTSTSDPDDDQVYYLFDWGDGTNSGWLGPYNSDDEISTDNSWNTRGDYQVKVKAKDEHRTEGPWSDPLSVTMSKNNKPFYPILTRLLEKIQQIFPWIEKFIKL